jgi:hypothetical protein
MPRAKQPFKLKRQAGAAKPVPLILALQSWLLVHGLHGGPHQSGRPFLVNYRAVGTAGQQAQLMSAQVLHEVMNVLNY